MYFIKHFKQKTISTKLNTLLNTIQIKIKLNTFKTIQKSTLTY